MEGRAPPSIVSESGTAAESDATTHRTPKARRAKLIKEAFAVSRKLLGVRTHSRVVLVQRIVIARLVCEWLLFREQVRCPSLLIRLVALGRTLRGLAQ